MCVLNNTGVCPLPAALLEGRTFQATLLETSWGDGAWLFILPAEVCTLGSYIVPVREGLEM